MSRRRLALVSVLAFTTACSEQEATPPEAASGPAEESSVVLQAVDAGTGGILSDDELTVRYLVRSPIRLDAAAVENVPSSETYQIEHEVREDTLTVEVRLEAPSYHTVDTVLSVARGRSSGPFTIRMARRLGRRASAQARPSQGEAQEPGASSESSPGTAAPAAASDGIDRTAMEAGNRAFERGEWSAARSSYQRMEVPRRESGDYARQYRSALVRRGISHINLGEWGSAMEALEEAVNRGSTDPSAHLHLGQAQCAVGLLEVGRETLARLQRLPSIPASDRPGVVALAGYHQAVCSQREYEEAEGTMNLMRTGTKAIQEFDAFIEEAQQLPRRTPQLDRALSDARARADEIRNGLRQLGRGGG